MLRFFHAPRSASSLYVALAALLLCLLAPARPASALTISTNETISTLINDNVRVVASPTGSPTVNLVDGGTIGGYLLAQDASTVNVSGGTIGSSLSASNASTVNVSGGTIGSDLYAFDTSTVNLSGGTIGGDLYAFGPDARLNVFGSNLSLSEPQTDGSGDTFVLLSGTLADGTPISNRVFLFGAQVSQIVLDPFTPLRAQVEALFADGTLNQGNTNALLVKLDAAQAALARGNDEAAAGALGAFINQVEAFVRSGRLSPAQGRALAAPARAIRDGIG